MPYAHPWFKQLGLAIGLAIVFIAGFVYLSAPPCAFGQAECPVGSTSIFSENVGIQGGTTFTTTLDSTPTVDGIYTIPDSAGNDTFALLGVENHFTQNTGFGTLAPTNLFHVSQSDVAAIAPGGSLMAAFESNSAQAYIGFISPVTGVSGLQFGDSGDIDRAHFRYSQAVDTFQWTFNSGTTQVASLDATEAIFGIGAAGSPGTGSGGFVFPDSTAFSAMAANTAGIYADDVAGTVEIFVIDEADSATQISPHPTLFLNTLGLNCDLPWAFESSNPYIGKKISVDLCGAIQALEVLTGQTFITITDLPLEDKKDWNTEQTIKFDKCIAKGGEAGEGCVREQPPQWMIDRGVQVLE